jgi:hypothetical protein
MSDQLKPTVEDTNASHDSPIHDNEVKDEVPTAAALDLIDSLKKGATLPDVARADVKDASVLQKLDQDSKVKAEQKARGTIGLLSKNLQVNGIEDIEEAKRLLDAEQNHVDLSPEDRVKLGRLDSLKRLQLSLPPGIDPESVLAQEWVYKALDIIDPEDPLRGNPIEPFNPADPYHEWLLEALRKRGFAIETAVDPNTGEVVVTNFLDPKTKELQQRYQSLHEQRQQREASGREEDPDVEKQRILDALAEKNIYDYEPNILTREERSVLLQRLQEEMRNTEDSVRRENLTELYGFIERNGYIFPEFSHGTSSDALASIVRDGLFPAEMARKLSVQDIHMQELGEGEKGGANVDYTQQTLSAGAGQGGLGTAIAYAEMIQNKEWNPNLLSEEELQRQLQREEQKEYPKKDMIRKYRTALARQQQGIQADYPVVIGFTGTAQVSGIEALPENNWGASLQIDGMGNLILKDGKPFRSVAGKDHVLGLEHALDSAVVFHHDRVLPQDIPVVSSPRENMVSLRQTLQHQGRDDIQVISLEALAELKNIGLPRVSQAEHDTRVRLEHNLATYAA